MNIRRFLPVFNLLACFVVATSASLLGAATFAQTSASLAPTPPMGWNSWNKFGCNVSDKLIREMADAMVSSGMQAAGYKYVNIDDCWQVSRDASGTIVADPTKFPSGIKALADYVHGKGLMLGIYTDAGTGTCEKRPGSLNHEVQDAKTYASWGIDYVKIDWCNAEGLDPEVQYAKFRDALANSGRPIVFSICNWGVKTPWRWGPTTGNLWRTTGDINDTYDRMSLIGFEQNGLEKFAGPGHWNDPDMLEIGNGGMKRDEYRTHMALWALLAAPLLAGNDLRNMSPETKELLMNSEVLAVDQDAKGVQGHRVWEEGPLEIWAKPLADGSHAVGLFNRSESPAKMTLDFNSIGAPASAKLRDLLDHKDLGAAQNSYSAEVPTHGVVLVKVSK
ncbi:MAG TPA: glycoside hydrolase family 27 protein [Candidatus Dormibacteraeota bacterium]|nr:glycoside hydrolase family 27 protein [Candidatus Dormibacteraeota bacterium]